MSYDRLEKLNDFLAIIAAEAEQKGFQRGFEAGTIDAERNMFGPGVSRSVPKEGKSGWDPASGPDRSVEMKEGPGPETKPDRDIAGIIRNAKKVEPDRNTRKVIEKNQRYGISAMLRAFAKQLDEMNR